MFEKRKILLIGGGGHCRSVLDSLLSMEKYDEIGIVDQKSRTALLGVAVVGSDSDLPRLKEEGWTDAFITVGSIGSTSIRRRLYDNIKALGFFVPVIADPTAIIARGTEIGEGVFLAKRSVVNAGSRIGCCAIINTGAIIEHDCSVGVFSHVSPGATVCGQTIIGADTHIGAGSVVREGMTIGCETLIGAGSVVIQNIPDKTKAFGNPCRAVVK